MINSIFCQKCGMLITRCICNKNENSRKLEKYCDEYIEQDDSFKIEGIEYDIITNKTKISDDYSIEKNSLEKNQINKLKNDYPDVEDIIIENFPFKTPRKGQLEIIAQIKESIDNGYKYIILEAGTGTGKSAIAATLAKIYESAYILTMTKQLQAQYAKEFNFPLVKGRGNFGCLYDNLDSSCDIGSCKTSPNAQKFFCPFGVSKNPPLGAIKAFENSFGNPLYFNSEDHCNYWQQKSDAINSPITLLNYDYASLELNYVKHFPKRNLLILDEAHNIENKLMKILELNLYNKSLQKDIKRTISPKTLKEGELKDWIMELEAILEAYKDLDISSMAINKAERIKSTISKINQLIRNLEKEPKNWVIDSDDVGVSFKPLKVHNYGKNYLFDHGKVILFLSATILSHKLFSKWLGLDPKEVFHIKVDSPFCYEKRPIIFNLAGKMSKNRIKYSAPKTIPILNKILKKHKNDKGLIHSHSYKCQHYITSKISNSRIISHSHNNRERVLKYFEDDDEPLVLVSPSMSEGVDLPYDKCRFQVIYKIPFPYLGDKQVNLRAKRDHRWYAYKTVMSLMQAYGRGMRAEDDECYTYILDEDIKMLLKSPRYKSLIPNFFKEAIIE